MITQYKLTQTMALDYATNPSNLYLNPYKDSLLNAIAIDEWPAAAYAKSLLYLIKGEQLGFAVPIMPRESNTLPKSEKTTEEIVKIFPNPSIQSLNIKSLDPKLNLVKIELLNLQGFSLKLIESNVKSQILDVSTIANCTYLIIIELSDGTRINKSIQVFH